MDTPSMCRICMMKNVLMHNIINTNLQEIYEKLTAMPFQRNDGRPTQVCYICRAQLQKCCQLRNSCLKSEELFTQILTKKECDLTPLQYNTIGQTPRIVQWSSAPGEYTDSDDEQYLESQLQLIKVEDIDDIDEILDESTQFEDNLDGNNIEIDRTMQIQDNLSLETPEHQKIQNTEAIDKSILTTSELNIEDILEEAIDASEPVTDVSVSVDDTVEDDGLTTKLRENMCSKTVKVVLHRMKMDSSDLSDEVSHNPMFDHNYSKGSRTAAKLCSGSVEENLKLAVVEKMKLTVVKENHQSNSSSIHKRQKSVATNKKVGKKPQIKREVTIDKKIIDKSTKKRLKKHINNLLKEIGVHSDQKPFKCPTCAKCYSRKDVFINHIYIHTGERPYKCRVCGKSFTRKDILTSHIRIHTGEKPYKCNICGRGFIQKCDLSRHTRLHNGEKPYKCDICGKCFNEKGNLSKHVRIHTGENPYECDKCGRRFNQKSTLTRHSRIHTGVKS